MLVFLIGYSFSSQGPPLGVVRDRPAQRRRGARRRAADPTAARLEARDRTAGHGRRARRAAPAVRTTSGSSTSSGSACSRRASRSPIIYLSYTLVTGEGGLISLCQITLAGIGAFAAARLAAEAGWPVWLAILVGALFAVPFGLLVALPSLRIGDLYLALLTLGFALADRAVRVETPGVRQLRCRPARSPTRSGFRSPTGWRCTSIVAVVFAVVGLLIVNLKRATSGLVFAAIRSSEPASMTSGISIVRAKFVLFGVSAFVAGLGGALYATVVGSATPTSFNALVGIVWLAIVVTWGVRSVIGALLAGMIFAIAPQRLSIILVLVFFLVVGGVFTRLALNQAYRKVLGALAMVDARGGRVRRQRVDLGQRRQRRRGAA